MLNVRNKSSGHVCDGKERGGGEGLVCLEVTRKILNKEKYNSLYHAKRAWGRM